MKSGVEAWVQDYWLHVNISYTHCTLLEAQSLHDTSTVPELHKIPQLQLRTKKTTKKTKQQQEEGLISDIATQQLFSSQSLHCGGAWHLCLEECLY